MSEALEATFWGFFSGGEDAELLHAGGAVGRQLCSTYRG